MTDKTLRPFNPGGLFRCCLQALGEMPDDTPNAPGAFYQCIYCNGWLRFGDGAWQWDKHGPAPTEKRA
jgi:hypothetical protein